MSFTRNHIAFSHLPERLTISFPLWSVIDTPGENSYYRDIDKLIREHKERSFNCIRIDDCAGLIHDLEGNLITPPLQGRPFGKYGDIMRQNNCFGGGGVCDCLSRLIEIFETAKKYDFYIILSSWYFLHTYWQCFDEELNDKLFAIPPHERFSAFAKFLSYIIAELEKRGLDDRIAFAEIFNEADGLPFINGYGGMNNLCEEEILRFKFEHEQALNWLQSQHPQILFAFDSYTSWTDVRQIPKNLQVFNFHSYYMWPIYADAIESNPDFFLNNVTEEEVRACRAGRRPAADDWYQRITTYNNLDHSKLPQMEAALNEQIKKDFGKYTQAVTDSLENLAKIKAMLPDVPFVCGEGVSYIGSKKLLWEEKNEDYWKLVEDTTRRYKDFGLWGTVIRTCCGPEDPSWNMCADKYLKINSMFLK